MHTNDSTFRLRLRATGRDSLLVCQRRFHNLLVMAPVPSPALPLPVARRRSAEAARELSRPVAPSATPAARPVSESAAPAARPVAFTVATAPRSTACTAPGGVTRYAIAPTPAATPTVASAPAPATSEPVAPIACPTLTSAGVLPAPAAIQPAAVEPAAMPPEVKPSADTPPMTALGAALVWQHWVLPNLRRLRPPLSRSAHALWLCAIA